MARCAARVVPLAAIQIVGFLGQEVVEHALAGRGIAEVVASPAIRLGVLLQVLVAVGMVLVVRAGRAVVARLREAGRPAHAPGKPVFPRGRAYSPVRTELTPLSRRGPPRAVHLVN